jgi:hypothetical protein
MRTFTEAELDVIQKFHDVEVLKGFIGSEANGLALLGALGAGPVTIQSVQAAAQACIAAGYKFYQSEAEMHYNAEYGRLGPDGKDSFGVFWYRPSTKRTLIVEGELGYKNAVALLKACKGKQVTTAQLDFELQHLANKGALHFQPVQPQADPRSLSGKVKGGFLSEEKNGDLYKGGRLNHARKPGAEQQLPKPTADAVLEQKANEVVGKTHSQTAAIRRMFKTDSNGNIDWQQTLALRLRAAGIQSIR